MGKELDPTPTDGTGLPNTVPLDLTVECPNVFPVSITVTHVILTKVVVVHHRRITITNYRWKSSFVFFPTLGLANSKARNVAVDFILVKINYYIVIGDEGNIITSPLIFNSLWMLHIIRLWWEGVPPHLTLEPRTRRQPSWPYPWP